MRESGIIYFKLSDRYDSGNTTYGTDITKNCGLNGGEIDKNFHFLRGSDIESGTWSPEDNALILKRVNGELIKITGLNASSVISFSGSTFTPENGGTLTLVVNDEESYSITGFTEACAELIESLSGISNNDELVASLNEDFLALGEYIHTEFEELYIFKDEVAENLVGINEEFNSKICDIKRRLENEILERKRGDNALGERISTLKENYRETLQDFTANYTQAISEFDRRLAALDNKVNNLTDSLSEIKNTICSNKNDLEEALRIEKEQRINTDRELGTEINTEKNERKNAISNLAQNIENFENSITDKVNDAISHNNGEIERLETRVEENATNIALLDSALSTEKNKRQSEDRRIEESVSVKENTLRELISKEKRERTNADSNLQQQIVNETLQRNSDTANVQNTIRNVQTAVAKETQARITELNRQRREIERLINSETIARRESDAEIIRGINNGLIGVEEDIEHLKDYAKWLYVDDRSLPHETCDEVLWGVVIRDFQDENGETRRKIVLNLDPNDKFLSQSCNYLSSTITLKYNEEKKHIELIGKNGVVASYIDANIFIQQGFLESVEVKDGYLILHWHGVEPTELLLSDLFPPYSEGNGIDIDSGNTISVTLGDGEQYLYFKNGKLATSGITEEIDTAIRNSENIIHLYVISKLNDLKDTIDAEITEIRTNIAELENSKLDTSVFDSYVNDAEIVITSILDNIQEINAQIENAATKSDIRQLEGKIENLETSLSSTNLIVSGISQNVSENRNDINALLNLEEEGKVDEYPYIDIHMVPAGAYEVGTYLHIDLTSFELKPGSYSNGPNTGVVMIGTPQTGFTQNIINRELTVTDGTNLRFRVTLTYSDGVKPYTNLGREGNTNGIQSQTITGYSEAITGFRYNFFASRSEVTQSSDFNNAFIRNLNKNPENIFNIQITNGNKEIIIAIPSGKTLVSVLDTNFNNTDIKGNFEMTACQVSGVNRYTNLTTYKVYYYIPDAPFTVNNTYKVIIE